MTRVSVADRGAAGDGTQDDTLALQTAVAEVSAAGGGVVEVPPGTYRLSEPLVIDQRDVFLEGHGPATVIQSDVSGDAVIRVNPSGGGNVGFQLRRITVVGSGNETALVRADYCLDGLIEDCSFSESGGDGLVVGRAQNVRIIGNSFRRCAGRAVVVTDTEGKSGQFCRIVDNIVFDCADGIHLVGGGEHIVQRNQLEKVPGVAILVTAFRNQVVSNVFELCDTPMRFGTSDAGSGRTVVTHNQIVGGHLLFDRYKSERFLFNTVEDRGNDGVPWSVTFRDSDTAGNTATVWAHNYEAPAGVTGRITDESPSGRIIRYESTLAPSTPGRELVLGDGDGQPAIHGFDALVTTNRAPTAIQDLVGGYAGQHVTIRFDDDVTSLVHVSAGGGFHLAGGIDLAAGTATTVALRGSVTDDGLEWFEVSRATTG